MFPKIIIHKILNLVDMADLSQILLNENGNGRYYMYLEFVFEKDVENLAVQ